MNTQDELIFAPETAEVTDSHVPWKVLIVDDEEEVHAVTKLALEGFHLNERPLLFLDAYTGAESVELMRKHPDVALILMDVVMENEHAGLNAVNEIRIGLANPFVRIVLRTGQPGQAPERDVVTRYDINDYKEKTELTAKKLFTVVYTSLHQYENICTLESHREKLQQALESITRFLEHNDIYMFAHSVLEELALLIDNGPSKSNNLFGVAVSMDGSSAAPLLLANTGHYVGTSSLPLTNGSLRTRIEQLPDQVFSSGDDYFAMSLTIQKTFRTVFFLTVTKGLRPPEPRLMDLFAYSVRLALENLQLSTEVRKTQTELVFMLSEAIEVRSRETGNHVRRVAEYSKLLAQLYGLNEIETHALFIVAPLHDAGKIGISDEILNKPGAHTNDEAIIMRTHVEIGEQMFQKLELPMLKSAAIVAGQHHERWDGLGYPRRLAGENIHIYGRIVALADVFDALGSHRCYKRAWPLDKIVQLVRDERGKHFDPKLANLLLDNLDQFVAIRNRLPDPDTDHF